MPGAVSVGEDDGEHAGEGIHGIGGSAVREEEDDGARGEVARLGFREEARGHQVGAVGEGGWSPRRHALATAGGSLPRSPPVNRRKGMGKMDWPCTGG
jgi:hypothetical protein